MTAVPRRGMLRCAGLAGLAAAAGGPRPVAVAAPGAPRRSPQQALEFLLAGNRRWATGNARHPQQSVARRRALVAGQAPAAVVLSCIDSRVPPELIFDCGLGDVVVIRTGAQSVDDVVLGSVEFGPSELSTPLIFVLGHQNCGAVDETIAAIQEHGGHAPGHIQAVVDALRPAYDVAVRQPGDLRDNMVRTQTTLTTQRLKQDALLAPDLRAGRLAVVGGRYELASGRVEVIA